MSCRTPHPDALPFILRGADHIVRVTDDEVEAAMRDLFADTHTVAEGRRCRRPRRAHARARFPPRPPGRIVISGGNVDTDVYARVLKGPRA